MNDVAAILLAAGRSRRMGAFKALLPFGDRTVIECCINNLRVPGVTDIIVVAGHRADEIQAHLKDLDLRIALNPDPDSAMAVSVACGLKQVAWQAGAVLVALVDHPAVPASIHTTLINEWRRGSLLVQPEYDGRGGHPVLIDLGFKSELLTLDPRRGLRSFFSSHSDEVRRVPVNSPYVARDMDTWEDYLRLHEDVFGTTPKRV